MHSSKSFSPNEVRPTLKVTEVKEEQDLKTEGPSVLTLPGISTDVKLLQLAKACSLMEVTLCPRSMLVKDEQSMKAPYSIVVTCSPTTKEVKDVQLWKVWLGREVIEGRLISVKALQEPKT